MSTILFNLDATAKEATLPAGRYVLGDPCYFVPDDSWDEALETSDFFQTRCYGTFTTDDGRQATVVAFGTEYGDGVYSSSIGFDFGVDAGLIGLAAYEAVGSVPEGCTEVFFKEPFVCRRVDGGTILLGHVEIHTGVLDDEDEDVEADGFDGAFDSAAEADLDYLRDGD